MRFPNKNRKKISSLDYKKKNRKKAARTILQLVFLGIVAVYFINVVLDYDRYQVPDSSQWSNREGFIALSYFGVSRSGSQTLIAKKQLDEQLQALKNHGYTTVSQQDLIDFYEKGKPLPDKALFLSFEDGRNDSSIYAQTLLEKYNFKATILTYANKFGQKREFKFLQPEDLVEMNETGYWELGSNGYRLTYINNVEKNGRFIDVIDESDFETFDVETYNHYLMDFIRDQNGIPVEDQVEMEKRIDQDYQFMKDIYTTELGAVPDVYMLMHANSLYNGMNPLVEEVNHRNITSMFRLHFNREGHAYNEQGSDVFNLSRVQPAPHWSTNHLLMKIREDSGQDVTFVAGDEELAGDWKLEGGAAEFAGNKVILTSPPSEEGVLYLKDSETYKNLRLNLRMEGIPEGKQSFYLRYNQLKGTQLKVVMENNELSVIQKTAEHQEQILKTVAVNGNIIKPLTVELVDHQLSLWLDEELLIENLVFDESLDRGGLALSSEPRKVVEEEQGFDDIYYKGNLIYDSIFSDIQMSELPEGEEEPEVFYSNSYSGIQQVVVITKEFINRIIDWTIATF